MKKISVFIDASNLFHSQKLNGWDIDFKKFKEYLDTLGEVVGLYYFTPSPTYTETEQVEGYRRFKKALIYNGYTVIDKEIKVREYTDKETGKQVVEKKGNLDGEIVLFMLRTYDQYDEMVFVGGDGDFEMILDHIVKCKKLVTCISNQRTTAEEIKNIVHKFIPLSDLKDIIKREPKTS